MRRPLGRAEQAALVGLSALVLCLAAVGAGVRAARPAVRVEFGGRAPYRIDLNRAPAEELTLLPDVGPVRAQRIVEWRREHGPFTSFDQLTQVSGISPRVAERIAEFATLGPPADAED